MALDAVAGSQPVEPVSLHGASGTASLAGAHDVDGFDIFEDIAHSQNLADFDLGGGFQTKFPNVALRFAVGFGGQLDASCLALTLAIRNQVSRNVATFLAC